MGCVTTENEGDGMLLAALLEGKILYASSTGTWFVWQGNVWRRDTINLVLGLVRYVTERYGKEIEALEEKIDVSKKNNDPEDHKEFAKSWNRKISLIQGKIRALRQDKGRNACVKFSYTHFENPFSIEGSEFDKNPWLLGVQNGVVDLRSGKLFPGRADQMVSKQCSCALKIFPDDVEEKHVAEWLAPWLEFLDTIYAGDQEIIAFMQILLGYGLTGLTSEHVFPFLLGRGRNGKSLFISSIMRVMGDYAAMIPCELFLKTNQPRSSNQTDPGIMKLEGLRLAVSSEVEEGAHFSAQQVKRLTGGDVLEGRNPYDKELRNFTPTHLNIMIGNHEPTPPSGDPAFWDRTFLINHPVRFVKHSPDPEKNEKLADPEMEDKLQKMDEQILFWLIEGCMKWQSADKKIIPPASVLKATSEYQADSDWIGQFLDSCCKRGDVTTGASTLYIAFTIWYQENINNRKKDTPTQRAFGLKLKGRGEFNSDRKGDGVYYHGLALNAEWARKMLEVAAGGDQTPPDYAF
jgi:putative DNA primase/helicase